MYEKPIEGPYRKSRRAEYRLPLGEARHVAPTEVRFESGADVKPRCGVDCSMTEDELEHLRQVILTFTESAIGERARVLARAR